MKGMAMIKEMSRKENGRRVKLVRIPDSEFLQNFLIPLQISHISHLDRRIEEFQHAEWAGDGIVLVHDNNVYFLADPRKPSSVERITNTDSRFVFNGLAQGIYNGIHIHCTV